MSPLNPAQKPGWSYAQAWKLKRAWRRVTEEGRSLTARSRRRLGREDEGIRPENVVWIFGTGRSGSTWLASMMGDLKKHAMWNEPLVGNLFGNFYYFRTADQLGKPGKHFILGEGYRKTWLKSIRDLVLDGAAARFPEVVRGGYLVIKEPNGSIGAPLMMEALP